jgi:hypothetical protein
MDHFSRTAVNISPVVVVVFVFMYAFGHISKYEYIDRGMQSSTVQRENVELVSGLKILAAITIAWCFDPWDTPDRHAILARQLQHYLNACELCYDIHVALISHESLNLTGKLDIHQFFCSRISSNLPVQVSLYPVGKLPKGTHGTASNLAFLHRKLFLAEKDNFDLFISQEDDAAIMNHHISYFLRWSSRFRGTNYYPGFTYYEQMPPLSKGDRADSSNVIVSDVFVDWTVKNVNIWLMDSIPLLSTRSTSGYIYMLMNNMLASAISKVDWLNESSAIGEFNPYFNSPRWLSPHFRIVTPLTDIHQSLFHHTPNKYVSPKVEEDHLFRMPAYGELAHALQNCGNFSFQLQKAARGNTWDLSANIDCRVCLKRKGGAVTMIIAGHRVEYQCLNVTEISFPQFGINFWRL